MEITLVYYSDPQIIPSPNPTWITSSHGLCPCLPRVSNFLSLLVKLAFFLTVTTTHRQTNHDTHNDTIQARDYMCDSSLCRHAQNFCAHRRPSTWHCHGLCSSNYGSRKDTLKAEETWRRALCSLLGHSKRYACISFILHVYMYVCMRMRIRAYIHWYTYMYIHILCESILCVEVFIHTHM